MTSLTRRCDTDTIQVADSSCQAQEQQRAQASLWNKQTGWEKVKLFVQEM